MTPTFEYGGSKVTSFCGTCIALALIILLILYAQTKVYVLNYSAKTTFSEPALRNYLDDSYTFESANGL